ncbi:MAG: hypothetical protein HY794_12825 [Desulfarculus sp.]|nr:hypothetical protein [Desulfarculus sp.]
MRYFGRDGAQCELPNLEAPTRVEHYRKLGRAVIHGRVPRTSVILMGVAVVVFALSLWLYSFERVSDGGPGHVRDAASAFSIRR